MAVMILGASLYGVTYELHEYLCTMMVAIGVVVFALADVRSKALLGG